MHTSTNDNQGARSATGPAIDVRKLRKTYPGGVGAVKDISFDVAAGEVLGMLGPNGAGKSTTIGVLTTTVRPTTGTASVAGYDVTTQPLWARAVSSVVFHDQVLDATLSGRRNIEIHERLWGTSRSAADRAHEMASLLGIDAILDKQVATYSGGQRRRLEIARWCRSRACFLDESQTDRPPRPRPTRRPTRLLWRLSAFALGTTLHMMSFGVYAFSSSSIAIRSIFRAASLSSQPPHINCAAATAHTVAGRNGKWQLPIQKVPVCSSFHHSRANRSASASRSSCSRGAMTCPNPSLGAIGR